MLQRMRAENFIDVKVMMVTSDGNNQSILRALTAGADESLMKPFGKEALCEKLALLGVGEE